jgi:hypothetical protein
MKTDLEYLIENLRILCNTLAMEGRCVFSQTVMNAIGRLEQLTTATEPVDGSVEIRVAVRLSPTGWYEASAIGENGDDRTPMVFRYPERGDDLFYLVTRRRVPSASVHTIPATVEEVKP